MTKQDINVAEMFSTPYCEITECEMDDQDQLTVYESSSL